MTRILLSIFMIVLSVNIVYADAVIYDFNKLPSNWRIISGDWEVTSSNTLRHTGDYTFNRNIILTDYYWSGEYVEIEVDIKWIDNGFLEDGIVWGFQDEDIFNEAYLSSWNHTARIDRFRKEPYETREEKMEEESFNVERGKWYHHKLVIESNGYAKLYIDGELVVEGYGYSNEGYIGLGCWKGKYGQIVEFDNFRVYSENLLSEGVTDCSDKYDEGYRDGKTYCREHMDEYCPSCPDCEECSCGGNEILDECATFNMFTNTLHVPCLDMGESYWLDLMLINSNPVRLELTDFGRN